MEDQQKPTSKIALNYGIILGFVSILISVALYATGMTYKQDWKTGSIGFIVTVVIIVMGIKKFKEANGGFLSVGQGLKTGVGIALIGSVISIIYLMVFMNYIEPDYMEKSLEVAREKLMENQSLSEDQVEQALEIQKNFSSPAIIAAVGLIWSIFLGFIISLITSLIMKKNEEDQY